MTSHNSSLTVILEVESREWAKKLEIIAREHIMEHFVEGSDPGLCIALADDPNLPAMAEFGLRATYEKVTMEEAYDTCGTAHLSGHGGTNMGVIGAAAGVGLTWRGESGRFVEFRTIRTIAEETAVSELSELGIMVISVNRHAEIPRPGDIVVNHGSLRPRLLGGRPVVPVISTGPGRWSTINEKADY